MEALPSHVFDDYFQHELSSDERKSYRGRQDLLQLDPNLRPILTGVQERLNTAFEDQRNRIFVAGENPRLYYGYVDAEGILNALAFHYKSMFEKCVCHYLHGR